MKAKEIRDLIDFIAQSPLDEVQIETDEFKISVKRYGSTVSKPELNAPTVTNTPQTQLPATEKKPSALQETPAVSTPEVSTSNNEDQYITIKSPMIGTFYRSPKPDSPSFVNIGDEVKEGQVVCIIEAMKLFNEIESEITGKVVKVLVENASPVEYDQPLFLVAPL